MRRVIGAVGAVGAAGIAFILGENGGMTEQD